MKLFYFQQKRNSLKSISVNPHQNVGLGSLVETDKGLFWWGCSNYKDGCKTMFYDKDGKPDIK